MLTERALMAEVISVLLVEDHALLRKCLRRALEDDADINVVGEAGNGVEAVQLTRSLRPAVVVMDMSMPVMDGLAATREILGFAPETAVLVLSLDSGPDSVRKAFKAGARGYLAKNACDLDLSGAIRRVVLGSMAPAGQ